MRTNVLVRQLLNQIEIMNQTLRLAMAEKNFSLAGLDANSLVAPNVGAAVSETADAVATNDTPATDAVLPNLVERDGTQAEAEGADFHTSVAEDVVETAPGKGS